MITDRLLTADDEDALTASLATDEEHPDLEAAFFSQPGTMTSVYEDETGPICYVRGTAVLRLDIHWVSNKDFRRNMTAMVEGFPVLEGKARANGFGQIVFESSVPLLRKFCIKRLGFKESGTELQKEL